MRKKSDKIPELIFKYITGIISEEEHVELQEWTEKDVQNKKMFNRLTDKEYVDMEMRRHRAVNVKKAQADMQARIERDFKTENKSHRYFYRMVGVAAAILLLIGTTFYIYNASNTPTTRSIVAEIQDSAVSHGKTVAVLTLDNGQSVRLGEDSIGNAKAMNNIIAENTKGTKEETVVLNLETPRGGEFKVTLEDGTEVWLNAQSQLRYPESFEGKERRVSLEGEAYFKVAKDAEKPFFVESGGQVVRVLGTEFNINSYGDDDNVYTTLVTGSVALKPQNERVGELVLTPGHQAIYDKTDRHADVRTVDAGIITSWRTGSFVFENQTLQQIMITLSRWYDFDYEFQKPKLKNIVFMGSVPRYGDFNDVLHILETSGNIKFKLNGKHLMIY